MLGWGHGRGGRGGHTPQVTFDGKLRAIGTDRFCTACGGVIKGLATSLLAKCPHVNCRANLPLVLGITGEEFDQSGWGRCRNCKSFIHQSHLYCQSCRHVNLVAKLAKDLQEKQALAKRQYELKKANEEKDAKIARLEARNLELNAIIGQQEAQILTSAERALEENSDNESFGNDGSDKIISQVEEKTNKSGGVAAKPFLAIKDVAENSNTETLLKTGLDEKNSQPQ